MITNRAMRWRRRQALFKPGNTLIDPDHYRATIITRQEAAQFIAAEHYLPTFPAAQLSIGYFRKTGPASPTELVGVCVFAVPSNNAVTTKYTAMPARAGTTLARFILLDSVPGNGETHFLSQARSLLRQTKPAIETFTSFADPLAGHIGSIYMAASARHLGRTKPRRRWTTPITTVSERALSKIALAESGHQGAIARLSALGAPSRDPHEDPRAWLQRLKQAGWLRQVTTPGLFIYTFPLTAKARAAANTIPTRPYPNLDALP
jgi:hypothetical protein